MAQLTSESLAKRLRAMVHFASEAVINHRLYNDLIRVHTRHDRIARESLFFWSAITGATYETVVLRLIRLYDQDRTGLSLLRVLEGIRKHPQLFSPEAFLKRMGTREYAADLALRDRCPDPTVLLQHTQEVSKADPLVAKLTGMRDRFYAHLDPRNVGDSKRFWELFGLSGEELSALVERAFRIANYYSDLYLSETTARESVGQNDLTFILEALHGYMDERERHIQAEIDSAGA